METFCTTLPEAMFPNFQVFTSLVLKLSDSPGRVSGGRFIKNDRSQFVTQICVEFDNMVAVDFKTTDG